MNNTDENRRPTEHAKAYVARTFAPRTIGSLVVAIFMFVVALFMIALTAAHIEPHFAFYAAGLTLGACGFVMVIGWGASSGHSGVTMCMAVELERRAHQLDKHLAQREENVDDRINQILEGQRKIVNALSARMETDLERRRGHHNN